MKPLFEYGSIEAFLQIVKEKRNTDRKKSSFFSLLAMLFTLSLAACGGGSGGGSGGASTSTPTNTTGSGGTVSGTSGLTSNLWVNQAFATISNGSISNPNSNLIDFKNMSVSQTPVPTVYPQSSYTYQWIVPDNAGNLWATETQIPTSTSGGTSPTLAIVKFTGASTNPSSITPTPMITLPSNVFVQSLAFDSSQNLYLDEESTTSTLGEIIKYSAPSYNTPTTLATYSQSGGVTSGNNSCQASAYLAFDSAGNLWASENYYNGSSCNNQIAEYNTSGTLINHYGTLSGSSFSILFDSSGNMWGLQGSCSGCSSNTSGGIWKWTGSPNGVNNPSTPFASFPSGFTANNDLQAVFDGNGNLWFGAESGSSSNNTGANIYELVAGSTTPTTANAFGNNNYIFGVAVVPAPSNLPIN